jgi:dynein heavy chain 1, cytosolic
MKSTLAQLLVESYADVQGSALATTPAYLAWIDKFPTQLVVVTATILWTHAVDKALADGGVGLEAALKGIENSLNILADTVLLDLPANQRKKYEHLITELVHQRDVTRQLIKGKIASNKDFDWLYQMRFYFDPNVENALQKLTIQMANAVFYYGFEYLGVGERLVQTPLTDRCYLTLTQVRGNC